MRAAFAMTLLGLITFAGPALAEDSASPAPTIELLTMGPGESIPERFGHAALCVRSPERSPHDRCYDYGIFDPSEPLSLGYRFLRGESVFWVAERAYGHMLRDYEHRDRDIWRQTLPLTADQAREMAAVLEEAVEPDNRYYHYHHYFDNCSTRVRDLIDDVTGGTLSAFAAGKSDSRTFRDITYEGFAEHFGLLIGTDVILGRSVDVRPDVYELMFLPDELRWGVEEALGVEAEQLYERRAPPLSRDSGLGALPFFGLVGFALLSMIAVATVRRRYERAAIAIAAVPLTVMGALLWSIAIVSPLPEVRFNELLLVFVPLDAALPFLSRQRRLYYAAARLAGLGVVLCLALVGLFWQPVGPALVALLPLAAIAAQSSRLRERWLPAPRGQTPQTRKQTGKHRSKVRRR